MARQANRRPGRRKTRPGGHGTRPSPVAAWEKTLRIGQIGRHGSGIAHDAGARIYLPHTLPGEEVEARISGEYGAVLQILEPSPERIMPICRHFTTCGGCQMQHANKDFIATWKRQVVATALDNRGISAEVAPVVDAHGAGRRRVTLHVIARGACIEAGFMAPRSHRLVAIDACPILVPALKAAPELARALAGPLKSHGSAFDVAMTATDTGLDVAVSGRGHGMARAADTLEIRLALTGLAEEHDLARLTLGGEVLNARRTASLTMGPARVDLPPGAFLQATALGEQALAGLAVEAVAGAHRIADLFAGLGPFALRLVKTATVHAVDTDDDALKALARAANAIGVPSGTTETRDLFRRPLSPEELAPYDAVIFDPPRAGAQSQAEALAASSVPVIVAVSCNPASFARDAARLIAGGYAIETITPVDQFKYSSHIEIVGIFRR